MKKHTLIILWLAWFVLAYFLNPYEQLVKDNLPQSFLQPFDIVLRIWFWINILLTSIFIINDIQKGTP